MEISNEIKSKIFAQYYGQLCLAKLPTLEVKQQLVVDGDLLSEKGQKTFKDIQLILKPLSAITDEDAKEVSIVGLPKQDYIWCATSGKDLVKIIDNKKCWSFYYKNADWFSVKQKLIDLGYDVFCPLIGNKTLKEVGLAIYEK